MANAKVLQNVSSFGPIHPDEADFVVDRMLEYDECLRAIKAFLAHEYPPSVFVRAIEIVAEAAYKDLYHPEPEGLNRENEHA